MQEQENVKQPIDKYYWAVL